MIFARKTGKDEVIHIFFNIIIKVINGIIEIITLLMFVRAILSWFPVVDRSSNIMSFIYMVTEAVISPVRRVIDRFGFARRFPIDISFLVTYLLLHLIQVLLLSL